MQSGYENLNQTSNNENQTIDTTISSINNDDRMIIKENDNTEMTIISENDNITTDDIGSMKIEKDNFLDNNIINTDMERGNRNHNLLQNRIISMRRFGKTYPFFFRKGEPMIVIGPHCNKKN